MRSKTTILGLLAAALLAILLMSASPAKEEAGYGYAPGEQLPSVEAGGIRWLSDLKYDSLSYVVVWSKEDAVARAVSSWLSRAESHTGAAVHSLCTDLDSSDAKLLSLLDNVSPGAQVTGLKSETGERSDLKQLRDKAEGRVFVLRSGVIQSVTPAAEAWKAIAL